MMHIVPLPSYLYCTVVVLLTCTNFTKSSFPPEIKKLRKVTSDVPNTNRVHTVVHFVAYTILTIGTRVLV